MIHMTSNSSPSGSFVGRAGVGSDLEQTEIMVVRGSRRLEKRSTGELADDPEVEHGAAELRRHRNVTDVEHGVVESVDTHRQVQVDCEHKHSRSVGSNCSICARHISDKLVVGGDGLRARLG